jgi:hypothetical protein
MGLVLGAILAIGQGVPIPQPAATEAVPKPLEVDFEAFDVTASGARPLLELVRARTAARFPPMIEVRVAFDTEIAQSVDEVR